MMDKENIHYDLLTVLKRRFPQENVVNILMDRLYIGREAAYRRMRGEVPFTLNEVAIMAKDLDLSLDNILGIAKTGNRPFQLVLTDHINPSKEDLLLQDHYIDFIRLVREDGESEAGYATNVIPMYIAYNYPHISKLYAFKHAYQRDSLHSLKSFGEIDFSRQLADRQMAHYKEATNIKNSFYIFDNLLFQYIINDIKYFSSICMIDREEVKDIKKDIARLINKMEEVTISGRFPSGKDVDIYISNINFDATYSYFCSRNNKLCMIHAFTLDGAASFNSDTFEKVRQWVQSLKRCSTLISKTGDVQRIRFFNQQRELLETFDA
jgi:hypothetical protein